MYETEKKFSDLLDASPTVQYAGVKLDKVFAATSFITGNGFYMGKRVSFGLYKAAVNYALILSVADDTFTLYTSSLNKAYWFLKMIQRDSRKWKTHSWQD